MNRQCKDCHFLVRYEVRAGDAFELEVTSVPWTDKDTDSLRDSVGERAQPPFLLVTDGQIGERFGAVCGMGVFRGEEGDSQSQTFHGFPLAIVGDEDEARQALKKRVESNRGRHECFFMARIEGMELDTARELEARRYSRHRDFVSDCKSYAALAVAFAAAMAAVATYLVTT